MDVEGCDGTEGGGGKPESWGVGVAADMAGIRRVQW